MQQAIFPRALASYHLDRDTRVRTSREKRRKKMDDRRSSSRMKQREKNKRKVKKEKLVGLLLSVQLRLSYFVTEH
jgi:hypothetical protein